MNALTFNTLLPHLLVRQARTTRTATAAPFIEDAPGRVVAFPAKATATATTIEPLALDRRDLAPLLRLVTWIFQPTATRKNIRLRIEAPSIGLFANCQELRIQRVLENLLANALRHAPENSEITLAARMEDGRLCFWVDDNGPGVPLAKQPGLFEPPETSIAGFAFDVPEDRSSLAICRDIVTAHGGEILMYNRLEGGAHFEFRLPSAVARHATAA